MIRTSMAGGRTCRRPATGADRLCRVPTTEPPVAALRTWLRGAGPALARQFAKFGVVGIVALTVDVGVFNLLLYVGDSPLLAGQPLTAKIASVSAATVVSWAGNRYWTFRRTRRPHPWRELALFTLMCTIGLGLALLCLAISHYVLDLTSPLADNIAANVVGLAVGTAFRFWAYRRFVFTHNSAAGVPVAVAS